MSNPGATATFVFRVSHLQRTAQDQTTISYFAQGTSVKYRSTRAWRQGTERVTLDGQSVMVDMSWPDASVAGDTVVVWEASGLALAQHTVVVTKFSPVDKDMVVW